MPTSRLKLFDYSASCNCYKVRLLLAHLGLDYERVPVDIFDGVTLSEEFGRINPNRTTPVLQTEDGRYLPESGAILFYLAKGTPWLPEDAYTQAQIVRWLIFEQTDIVPLIGGLRFRVLTGRLQPTEPEAIRRREGGEQVLSLLDQHLSGHAFFAGESYTIADIAVYGYVHLAHEAGFELGPHEHLRAWFGRVQSQPGFIDDVEPYPANAAPGKSRSLYG
jgi:glutathione S-transferase